LLCVIYISYPHLPRTAAHKKKARIGTKAYWRGVCGEVKLGGKMKYAIVEDGGKQYKAIEGSTIEVDRFAAEVGEQVDLENVLMVVDGDQIEIGTPTLDNYKVQATVVAQIKGPKIIVFKYKPRNRYRVKSGHRQKYTRLQIDTISPNGTDEE
jgi:large subunit ribosomal protein L21